MTSTKLIMFAAVLACALVAPKIATTSTAAAKPEDNFTLVKVADGVYAAIAKAGGLASGNAGFVVGDNGVLVFDTFFTPQAIEDLLAVIESETKKPVKFAVNSHYHLETTERSRQRNVWRCQFHGYHGGL